MTAHQYFPYLSPYVYSLVPVERPGLGTMAVDMQGRMYFDPDFCEKLTLDQGAYVVLHEAWHLILRHCHRSEKIIGKSPTAQERRWYNIAVDLVVWELMEGVAEHAPPGGVTWKAMKDKYPSLQRNMLPEEIYSVIAEKQEASKRPPEGHKYDEQEEQEKGDKQDSDEEGGEEGGDGRGDETSKPKEPEDQIGDGGDGPSEGDDDGSGKPEPTERDTEGRGKGGGQGDQDGPQGEGSGTDQVEDDGFDLHGGSAADGDSRDYEEEPNPNWDAFIEDQLLDSVEKKIEEHERTWHGGRGTVPGCLKETIRKKLRPAPNPWDSLRASVALAAANPRGAEDHTYQRPNRRQYAMPEAPRLKGLEKYSPKVVMIIDTSGSMTQECKRKCLNVVAQGLRAVGDFHVIFGDTRVHADVKFTGIRDEVEMPGGGGTDMRVLIAHAEKIHKPNVIVIGTDGGTPWPDVPTKAQLIVALTQELPTPSWATRVRIPDDPRKDSL